jgi:hypothetical protein
VVRRFATPVDGGLLSVHCMAGSHACLPRPEDQGTRRGIERFHDHRQRLFRFCQKTASVRVGVPFFALLSTFQRSWMHSRSFYIGALPDCFRIFICGKIAAICELIE